MSSDAALHSSSASRQPTWSFKIQNFSTPQTYAAKSAVESKATAAPNHSTSSSGVSQDGRTERRSSHAVRKRRKLNEEEEELKSAIAESVAANLQIDQLATLYPDAESPFENELDIVRRLLPYHIYQHPLHDLDEICGSKGKAKASETDMLKEEIQETKFALQCHKRLRSLEHRMKKARLKAGRYTAPVDQSILIERMMLETEHVDKATLEHELSTARSELDKMLRAQRIAKATANRATTSTSVNGTTTATPYYAYTNSTYSTSYTPSYSSYYGSYAYPYTQSFIPGVTYAAAGRTGSSSIPGVTTFQTGAASQSQRTPAPNAWTNQTATPSSTGTTSRPPPVAIPLQLPVTSLPALQSLGILPVPKASLPEDSSPQAAAVLLGSTNNGTMLSLEINAALLQPHQMSGLAILLSSLVKMSGGPVAQSQPASTGGDMQGGTNAVAQTSSASGTGASNDNPK